MHGTSDEGTAAAAPVKTELTQEERRVVYDAVAEALV